MALIRFNREFEFRYGVMERLTPLVRRVVARNPGPFTFHGTSTFVVGNRKVAVIDPGPALAEHVEAIVAGLKGETVSHIIATHTHADHSPACRLLQERTGAPTYGFGPHGSSFPPEYENGKAALTANSSPTTGSATAASSPVWTGICAPSTPPATAPTICASPCPKKTRCSAATS